MLVVNKQWEKAGSDHTLANKSLNTLWDPSPLGWETWAIEWRTLQEMFVVALRNRMKWGSSQSVSIASHFKMNILGDSLYSLFLNELIRYNTFVTSFKDGVQTTKRKALLKSYKVPVYIGLSFPFSPALDLIPAPPIFISFFLWESFNMASSKSPHHLFSCFPFICNPALPFPFLSCPGLRTLTWCLVARLSRQAAWAKYCIPSQFSAYLVARFLCSFTPKWLNSCCLLLGQRG